MNNNFQMPLFKFRQGLNMDQVEVSNIVGTHLEAAGELSEKELLSHLSENLKPHTYDRKVVSMLEGLNDELSKYKLLYDLKDLYRKLERSNYGHLYTHPMKVVLECINMPDDESRTTMIMTELKNFEWIPEVNTFLFSLHKQPHERETFLTNNGAKAHPVYTLVEPIEEGDLIFVHDSWLLFTENSVTKPQLDQILDADQLSRINLLSEVMRTAEIDADKVSFYIDESLTLSIGVGKDNFKQLFINEELAEKETTLETIFESPLVHFMRKGMYPVVLEAFNSIERFNEMPNVSLVTVHSRPDLYVYAIDANETQYVYNVSRLGKKLYEYESVSHLLEEVKAETGFNLSYMFEDKLTADQKNMRNLEDQEKMIQISIRECMEGLAEIQSNIDILNVSPELNEAYDMLQMRKVELEKELKEVRGKKLQNRYDLAV